MRILHGPEDIWAFPLFGDTSFYDIYDPQKLSFVARSNTYPLYHPSFCGSSSATQLTQTS